MKRFETQTDIGQGHYRALLGRAERLSASFLLVVRHETLDTGGQEVVDALRPFLVEEREQSEWPGTLLFGNTATVPYYLANHESLRILERSASSVFEWQQPERPEDLCFLRHDGSAWFLSIAHEGYACFDLLEAESIELRALLKDLKAKSAETYHL